MRYADLHVHTNYSDSTLSPEEVVSRAKEADLSAIAICDHDSVDAIEPSTRIAKEMDIEVIPSVELTVEKTDAEVHILGYFIDWKNTWFQERLKENRSSRVQRVYKMVEKLNDYHIKVDPNEVFKLAGKGSVGRLHLARAILKAGYIKNLNEAFSKYIGFLKPCYVSYVKFSPKEAIELILKVGGVPVLAHPGLMGKDGYIDEFIGCGLKGIEVYHTDHKPRMVKHYEEFAKDRGLLMTGGSDCHGLGKGRVLIGSVKVSYELVERLKKESKKDSL